MFPSLDSAVRSAPTTPHRASNTACDSGMSQLDPTHNNGIPSGSDSWLSCCCCCRTVWACSSCCASCATTDSHWPASNRCATSSNTTCSAAMPACIAASPAVASVCEPLLLACALGGGMQRDCSSCLPESILSMPLCGKFKGVSMDSVRARLDSCFRDSCFRTSARPTRCASQHTKDDSNARKSASCPASLNAVSAPLPTCPISRTELCDDATAAAL